MKNALKFSRRETAGNDELLTGYNSKFTVDGHEIAGIEQAVITFTPGDFVRAELQMYTALDTVDGIAPRFMMSHPLTGEWEQVRLIEFASGEKIDFENMT